MNRKYIDCKNIEFIYKHYENENSNFTALKDVSCSINEGEFVAVLGRNGSGKSTFARLLNVLLLPSKGFIYIDGINTLDEEHTWNIRQSVGMVFQNPDNQIVGTTVEEDAAFGPENMGINPKEIRNRVYNSLEQVNMQEYARHSPHLLSGGQKQRVAIAGILAMKPKCIVFDEATAMLDPVGRKEVINIIKKINKEENITIVHITHHMDEAVEADRVIVLDKGKIKFNDMPKKVFLNVDKIKALGLDVPQVTELIYELNMKGLSLPQDILDVDEAAREIVKLIKKSNP